MAKTHYVITLVGKLVHEKVRARVGKCVLFLLFFFLQKVTNTLCGNAV